MKILLLSMLLGVAPLAQVNDSTVQQAPDSSAVVMTLEDVIKVALSENISVKVADKEIQRKKYAVRGTYAALFPQVDANMAYQRTIKKQVMYMDVPIPGMESSGLEVGRWNTWSGGVTAAMPLVSAQLWESIKITADEVELAVEKARGSRLAMLTEVKTAFFGVLLAKESLKVYKQVYDNAMRNLDVTQLKFNAQKASEMDLVRAKTTVANAVPNLYSAANDLDLALWQLKAVMGVDLDYNIDVDGKLEDYAQMMFYDVHEHGSHPDISRNTSLRQMEIQLTELARTIRMNQYAYIPSLAVNFSYSYNAMDNGFDFKNYRWTPYSYVGVSLQIPIFSGGKRLYAVKQSKVQYDQAKLQQTQLERQLRIGIKAALGTMESNMNGFYAAQSAVESASKAYDIVEKSYEVGRSTIVEVNDAMLAMVQAQMMQWTSIYSFLAAKAQLEEQLGVDYIEK